MAVIRTWLQRNAVSLEAAAFLVQIISLPLLLVGALLTFRQLTLAAEQVRYAAQQTQGQTILAIGKDSRDLFLKVWEDPALRPILDPTRKNGDPEKVRAFLGTVISHYAMIFRQWKLGNIPNEYWHEVSIDAKAFFKSSEGAKRWRDLRRFYSTDFQQFVDAL